MKDRTNFKQLGADYDRAMRGPLRAVFGPTTLSGGAPPDLHLERLLGDVRSVLEVGCGQGYLLEKALRQLKPDRLVGVDLSEVMLSITQERLERRGETESISTVQGEATTLPFQDKRFDAVLSMGMMEHLDDELLVKFMAETRRVLKPEGRLLAWTLSRRSPIVLVYRTPGWISGRLPAYGRTMIGRSPEELCRLAKRAGFMDSRRARLGRFFPFYSAVLACGE
jgi:ubiquinone/menaquinone biosynthesis C-methylase UbiE